jgi:hypothetical protein
MSVSAGRSKLAALTHELAAQWQQTKESWRDAKSLEFEQKYLNELFTTVNAAVIRTEELAKILAKIRSDCE